MAAPLSRRRISIRRGLLLAASGALFATGALAADPTPEQQYWLEILNRMRRDPAAELEHLVNFSVPGVWGTPKSNEASIAAALDFFGVDAGTLAAQWSSLTAAPPLAWSSALNASATAYSNAMVNADLQAHGLDGLTLEQRITGGGYSSDWLELGETLFATSANPLHGHAAMAIDWGPGPNGIQSPPTHREAVMEPLFKEVGIGFQSIGIPGANSEAVGPLVVTQHFASQFRLDGANYFSDAILTGVVFVDTIAADLFYTPGEGWAGTEIRVYEDETNLLVAAGFTNSAGGYNITLTGLTDAMVYRVEAPETGLPGQTFSLNAQVVDYGVPVTFYDNTYAAFQVVPEPGSALFVSITVALAVAPRRRASRLFA